MKKTVHISTLLTLCLLFIATHRLQAQLQKWVYAGTPGQSGYTGDGYVAYPPNPVRFNGPYGLAIDAKGNLYIADINSHVVRKVDTNSHIITTVAGNGLAGNNGVDIFPPTGIGSLGPGGPSASDSLYYPSVFAYNSVNNCLYIGQYSTISKLNLTTNDLSPVAGNGGLGLTGNGGLATAAKMKAVFGIALSPDGKFLYEAENANSIVRKIDLTTGIITPFAGSNTIPNSSGGFSGDGGLATAAQLSSPYGVATDVAGNVYIADLGNKRIRKVGTDGIITTIAGGGTVAAGTDNVVATSVISVQALQLKVKGDSLVFADGPSVRSIDLTTNLITTLSSGYSGANDIAFYGGKMFVSDVTAQVVYQVSSTGAPTAAALAAGTIDCSKTQLVKAPTVGTASQLDLVITATITTAGCVGPIAVSGSGMSMANGLTEICTTTTGVQTFHIPLTYNGSALGATTFSFSDLGSCSADLSILPVRSVNIPTTFLTDCTPITPVVLSK